MIPLTSLHYANNVNYGCPLVNHGKSSVKWSQNMFKKLTWDHINIIYIIFKCVNGDRRSMKPTTHAVICWLMLAMSMLVCAPGEARLRDLQLCVEMIHVRFGDTMSTKSEALKNRNKASLQVSTDVYSQRSLIATRFNCPICPINFSGNH